VNTQIPRQSSGTLVKLVDTHVSTKIFHNNIKMIIKIINPIICWMGACCTAGFDEGPLAASCSTFGDEAAAVVS